jgi:ABC-type amino acid transport system permease subunit
VVGTSVLALTFTGLGMTRYSVGNMRTAIDPDHIDPLARAGSTMLHVQYEIGFWACILALLISAAMAFMVARQEAQSDLTVTDMPVPQPAPAPAPAPAPSDDTAPTPPDKG